MSEDNIKTIAICGSMQVIDEMIACSQKLEQMGIATHLPKLDEAADYGTLPKNERATTKARLIRDHIEKINESDAVLIYNTSLSDRINYIGANSFLEMGFAFAANKPIYLLNDIPNQPNSDEIAGMLPICLEGNLSLVRQ